MDEKQFEILKTKLNIELSEKKKSLFNRYIEIFCAKNSHTNLMSKNDEKLIFEKHIFDSLALNLFFTKNQLETKDKILLDIGTGGGFPLLPLGIVFDKMKLTGLDSTSKKVKIINEITHELGLKNVKTVDNRAENFQKEKGKYYDYITARAVGTLDLILKYALPLLNKNGYFIAYKSKLVQDEIKKSKNILKAHRAKVLDIIEYKLPLEEVYERNLVIIKC